jgi:biotin carboxylase
MVLGGGSSQIPAIRRAGDSGFEVILADRDPGAPGREWAHRFVNASTFDHDAVTRAAYRTGADALLAVGSDQPVHTAAIASERLGLPYPLSPEQAQRVTNKAEMKTVFHTARIPTVNWTLLDSNMSAVGNRDLADVKPPWVVKPVDSQGQRGIRLVHNRAQLNAHIPVALSYSRDSKVLVEEYYPSREVTISGWADQCRRDSQTCHPGGVHLWSITDRVTYDPARALGVCFAHRYPSEAAAPVYQEIPAVTERIVRAFGMENVPVYFQMLVGEQGLLVNEIACRLGGAYEDQFIPGVTGIDVLGTQLEWYRNAIAPALAPIQREPVQERARACVVPLLFCRPGVIASLSGDEVLRSVPGITECRFLLTPGTRIGAMTNSTQRTAYAIIHGDSAAAVNALVDRVFDTLRVENHTGENLLIDTRDETKLRCGVL